MKDLQVLITNVTEKKMAVMPAEAKLGEWYVEARKNHEIEAAYQITILGYTVIKKEWRETGYGDEALFVTFGKMEPQS